MLLLLLQGGSIVVIADGATQANTSTSGAVVQSYALSASGVTQTDASASGAVSQTHLLQCDVFDAGNMSGSGAILQVHLLHGENASQNNICKELIYYGAKRGRTVHTTKRMANDIATRPMSLSATRQSTRQGTRQNIQTRVR